MKSIVYILLNILYSFLLGSLLILGSCMLSGVNRSPAVSNDVLQMHNSLTRISELSSIEVPNPMWRIYWSPIISDNTDGVIIFRANSLIGFYDIFKIVPDIAITESFDSTIAVNKRYFYCLRSYRIETGDTIYNENLISAKIDPVNPPLYTRDETEIVYSAPSDTISAMWVSVGPDVAERETVILRDLFLTTEDALFASIPKGHPYKLIWNHETFEYVVWRGLLDINGDGTFNMSDLPFVGFHYAKSAYDSVSVE